MEQKSTKTAQLKKNKQSQNATKDKQKLIKQSTNPSACLDTK